MHVGDDVIVGDGCAGNLCDVVLDLVANVGHFFGVLILVASCRAAAAVLDVRVMRLDLEFEVVFGEVVVSLMLIGCCSHSIILALSNMLELYICSR